METQKVPIVALVAHLLLWTSVSIVALVAHLLLWTSVSIVAARNIILFFVMKQRGKKLFSILQYKSEINLQLVLNSVQHL
jgi:hypothetical protein